MKKKKFVKGLSVSTLATLVMTACSSDNNKEENAQDSSVTMTSVESEKELGG